MQSHCAFGDRLLQVQNLMCALERIFSHRLWPATYCASALSQNFKNWFTTTNAGRAKLKYLSEEWKFLYNYNRSCACDELRQVREPLISFSLSLATLSWQPATLSSRYLLQSISSWFAKADSTWVSLTINAYRSIWTTFVMKVEKVGCCSDDHNSMRSRNVQSRLPRERCRQNL